MIIPPNHLHPHPWLMHMHHVLSCAPSHTNHYVLAHERVRVRLLCCVCVLCLFFLLCLCFLFLIHSQYNGAWYWSYCCMMVQHMTAAFEEYCMGCLTVLVLVLALVLLLVLVLLLPCPCPGTSVKCVALFTPMWGIPMPRAGSMSYWLHPCCLQMWRLLCLLPIGPCAPS